MELTVIGTTSLAVYYMFRAEDMEVGRIVTLELALEWGRDMPISARYLNQVTKYSGLNWKRRRFPNREKCDIEIAS